jgi:ABC-type sugar transport system ATPase subunit
VDVVEAPMNTAADTVLRTDALVKRFGGITATNNVSLTVTRGARHALIGPNGAGKTTLINQLTGVLAPNMTAAKSPESSSDGRPINMPGPDGSSCPGISMMQASMVRCSLRGSPSCRELTAIGTDRKPVG